jgi:hypothetical protein
MGAAIGGAIGAARPITLGRDVTDESRVQANIKSSEAWYGRELPPERIVSGGILSEVIGLGGNSGITLGGLINVTPNMIYDGDILRHEFAHALQYERDGLLKFQWNYITGGRAAIEHEANVMSGTSSGNDSP